MKTDLNRRRFLKLGLLGFATLGCSSAPYLAYAGGPRRGRGKKPQPASPATPENAPATPPPVRPGYSNSFEYLSARKREEINACESRISLLHSQIPALRAKARGKYSTQQARVEYDAALLRLVEEKQRHSTLSSELVQLQAKSKASVPLAIR